MSVMKRYLDETEATPVALEQERKKLARVYLDVDRIWQAILDGQTIYTDVAEYYRRDREGLY